MDKKVNWGVLGVADIAVKRVIPAMQQGQWSQIIAIASRDLKKAQQAAQEFGIKKAYGSYDELLADPDVEAIYNPLPNYLHVSWSIKAAEAGKHVLCEKPISVSVEDAITLLRTRDRTGVKIEEAFMVRVHPQWVGVLDLISKGRIGAVRSVAGFFAYYLTDPQNVRNILQYSGGALMDVGCYLVYVSRLAFSEEPKRVLGLFEADPKMKIDRLTCGILDFPSGQCMFTCSTQIVPYQRVQIFGTKGRIELEIPFNAPTERPCRIFIDDGADISGRSAELMEFEICNQYTIQGDLFSKSIRQGTELPVPLDGSVKNMAVIEALFRSAKTNSWETPGPLVL